MEGEMGGRKKVLKPADCGNHIRERLAENFEGIVNGFVKEAMEGSCPHVKFVCELLETEPKVGTGRKKGSAELMLAEWKKRGKPQRARGVDGRFVAGSGAKAPSVERLGSGA
jgi:hypothetical protein